MLSVGFGFFGRRSSASRRLGPPGRLAVAHPLLHGDLQPCIHLGQVFRPQDGWSFGLAKAKKRGGLGGILEKIKTLLLVESGRTMLELGTGEWPTSVGVPLGWPRGTGLKSL